MKVLSLVFREIRHRPLGFLLSLLAVIVPVAGSVGVMTLTRAHQLRSDTRVKTLDDEIRKITKNMGFNIMILPDEQNLADFHAEDFADKTMPVEFVTRLAESPDVVTINHLRPALIRKVDWPEKDRQVLLWGVSGVVPFAHRDPKKPLSQPVPPGTMNVGHVLARELRLSKGDEVALQGRTFQVGEIYPQRGSKDDITVWIDLAAAQELLELPDRISLIQALECNCATIERLAEIQGEIATLLGGDVQVIEMTTIAIARAKARNEVRAQGVATVRHWQRLASLLLPLVISAAAVLVGLLTWSNVRERRGEIGILRALGTRSGQILGLFVSKAVIVGLLGAALGYALGFWGAAGLELGAEDSIATGSLFLPQLLGCVLLLTPLLAVLASWLPSLAAAHQDPAVVLREE